MKQVVMTDALYSYIKDIYLREDPVLLALREDTKSLPLHIMQITPEQAQFMQFMLRLIRAKNVLEIGTFTGYSALAMAYALPNDGHLITCDISKEWTDRAKPFWEASGQKNKIELRIGPALNTLDQLLAEGFAKTFDFIFIDADKTNYIKYYEQALRLVSPKGFIAIDNVLWNGKVVDPSVTDAQTREIRKLNALIKQDNRVDISLLTIADGLLLIQESHNGQNSTGQPM